MGVWTTGRRKGETDTYPFQRARLNILVLLGVMIAYGMIAYGGDVHAARHAHVQTAHAQTTQTSGSAGHPLLHTFPAGAYDGSPQLWAVTQDDRGLLYIGGQRYLRQYDGVRWRGAPRLSTTSNSAAYSLTVGPHGRVFAGLLGGLNVLRPDSTGTLATEAVAHAVPDSLTGPREPFDVVASARGVFVRTGPALWQVATDSLHRLAPSLEAQRLVSFGRRVLVQSQDGALIPLTPQGPVDPIARAPELRTRRVVAALPHPDVSSRLDVLVLEDGLARWTPSGSLVPLIADGNSIGTVRDAVRLPDASVALATETRGILILDPDTGTRRWIDTETGLPVNSVTDLHVSARGALWATTANGLVRIEWPAPWTRVPALSERIGSPTMFLRAGGTLYAGGTGGLFRLRGGGAERVAGIAPNETVYDAVRTVSPDTSLLVSADDGIYAVRGRTARRIAPWRTYGLVRSRKTPTVVYAGFLDGGVGRLQQENGRWQPRGTVRDVDGRGFRVAEDTTGAVWVGTGSSGLYRVEWPVSAPAAEADVARFDTTDGLPAPSFNFVAQIGPTLRALTLEGLYRFDRAAERFVPDSAFAAVYADDILTGWPVEAQTMGTSEEVWMDFGGYKFGVARRTDAERYAWTHRPFRRLADFGDVEAIYPDGDSLLWVGTAEGVLRYDRRRSPRHARPFRALVRSVTLHPDAPGGRARRATGGDAPLPNGLRLAYADNTLRIAFGATSYESVDGALYERGGPLQFRYRLDGYDAGWSAWSSTPQKDYTGLPEGRYAFRLQARNLYNHVGQEATLSLRIAPPWYRTGWAYAGYALVGMALIAAVVAARTRRLHARRRELEATVAERTEEVRAQKETLAQQAEELQALDAAKSRFFANISHEFRTPLTLILGPVRQLRRQVKTRRSALPDAADRTLGLVERNAHRLLRLVQQVLALARHDAGTLRLHARPADVAAETRRVTQAFAALAERQDLTLTVKADSAPEDALPVYLDGEAFEQLLGNLLSNAIKFTPAGGAVHVTLTQTADAATLRVADTGRGIPSDIRDRIFDRFVQADDSATRSREGAGIGLALTRTLVDLHGGTIRVESTSEAGTTFAVVLPRGAEALPAATQVDNEPPPHGPEGGGDDPGTDAFASAPAPPEGERAGRDDSNDAEPEDDRPLVLVVDDNADVRTYIQSVLTPGFRIAEAGTGTDGLAQARAQLPDVILADVMMPEMDGLRMTEALRADPETAALPIVMLTARAGTDDEVEGLAAGATDYIIKPFDPQVLEMRVRGTLAYQHRLRRRLLEELRAESAPAAESGRDGEAAVESDRSSEGPDDESGDGSGDRSENEGRSAFENEMRAVIAQRLPDPTFDVSALAEALAMSRSTLYRRARSADAPSPAALIRTMRIERGAELLRAGSGTVSEVAYAVGFNSLSHFSTQFADHVGRPPSAYAAACQDDL